MNKTKKIGKLGRPKSIDKNKIILRCCNLFWQKGINNVSFNDAIRYSEVSKGTIYNYFNDIDSLHKATFEHYYTSYISEIEKNMMKYDNVFEALLYLDKKVLSKDYKPCYFFVSNAIRMQLGNRTNRFLVFIEYRMKKLWKKLLVRHIKTKKLNKKLINSSALSSYLIHNFTLINVLIANKTSKKDIKILIKSMKSKVLQDLDFKIA